MNWVAWKNIYGKQPKIKYNGLSFFSDIWRIPSLLRKKKLLSFVRRKQMIFPVAVMSKVYRKTQLSYSPNCYWSQWMVFYLSTEFVKMSGLPSSQPSPSPWESSPGKRKHHSHSWFWSLDRFVQWISALLHHMFPGRWMYTVKSCLFALFICTQKAADEAPSPEEFSACSAICYKESAN